MRTYSFKNKRDKYATVYFKCAQAFGAASVSTRLQVGAVFVRDREIIATGLNGTIEGHHTNCCELPDGSTDEANVLHAEENAITKANNEGKILKGATVYLTHAPCPRCAKLMAACKVKEVLYLEDYRDMLGVQSLIQRGIPCTKEPLYV